MRHIDHFTAFLKRPPTIALMAVYLVVMFWQQHHGQTLTKDSLEYLNAGKNILHSATLYAGDLNDLPDYRLYSKRPPLYPLILISTFFNQWVLFIVQIFAGVFALFLGTEIGRILQSKPLSDRQFNLYMLLALLFPAQWIYGSVVMSDLLLQLFLTSAVYFLLIISTENKSVAYWGFALSLSAGMLLKPVMAPIALLSPLLLVLRTVRSGGLKKILLMIPVLVFLGFSFRNHTMSGQFEYSSISHINLLQYNTRYLLNFTHGEQVSEEMLSDLMIIPRNEKDYDTWVNGVKQLGIQSISKHPFQYAWIHVSGMFRMLLDPGRFDLALLSNASYQESEGFLRALSTDGIRGLWKVLKQSPFFLILLFLGMIKLVKLALFFFACYQNRFNARLWMAIGIPVIILALTGPIGASRFMLPLVPIYLIVISMVKLRH